MLKKPDFSPALPSDCFAIDFPGRAIYPGEGLPMRRAQWKINQPPSLERKRASLEGSYISFDARSEGQSGDSPGREGVMVQRKKHEALAWDNGTSREIDCEAIGG